MSSSPNPCSKKVFLDQVAQGLVQLSSKLSLILKGQGVPSISGQPVPVFDHSHGKKFILNS